MDYLKMNASKVLIKNEDNVLEHELYDLVETFRDPQLSIQTLEEMQSRQDQKIAQLKKMLSDFDNIKELLKENEFKTGDAYCEDMFGELNLYDVNFWPLKSKIVNAQQWNDLMELCEFPVEDKWTLIYRGSADGFGANDYHSKCDTYTLTIIKVNGSSNIFGGFTSEAWDSNYQFREDANSFLFSLINQENKPIKMKIKDTSKAILILEQYLVLMIL